MCQHQISTYPLQLIFFLTILAMKDLVSKAILKLVNSTPNANHKTTFKPACHCLKYLNQDCLSTYMLSCTSSPSFNSAKK